MNDNNGNNFNINNPFLAMGNNSNNNANMNAPVNYNNTNNNYPVNNVLPSNGSNQNSLQINDYNSLDKALQINQFSKPVDSPSPEQLDSILGVGNSVNTSNNNPVQNNTIEQNQNINSENNSNPMNNMTNNEVNSIPTNTMMNNETPEDKNLDNILGLNGINIDTVENQNNENNTINYINDQSTINNSNSNLGVALIILSILSFIALWVNSLLGIIGVGISAICFVVSIINIKKKVKYTKISAVLSLIVIATFIFMITVSTKTVNDYLSNTKIAAFKDDAQNYIDAARKHVNNNGLNCSEGKEKDLPLELLLNESAYLRDTSIFNNKFDLKNSFVRATATDETCLKFDYSIYITDGEYSIGKSNEPVSSEVFQNNNYEIKK